MSHLTEEIKQQQLAAIKNFKLPCHYEQYGQIIHDADGRMMLDVRGWGYLQYLKPNPEELQDNFAGFIVRAINDNERLEAELSSSRERIKLLEIQLDEKIKLIKFLDSNEG